MKGKGVDSKWGNFLTTFSVAAPEESMLVRTLSDLAGCSMLSEAER